MNWNEDEIQSIDLVLSGGTFFDGSAFYIREIEQMFPTDLWERGASKELEVIDKRKDKIEHYLENLDIKFKALADFISKHDIKNNLVSPELTLILAEEFSEKAYDNVCRLIDNISPSLFSPRTINETIRALRDLDLYDHPEINQHIKDLKAASKEFVEKTSPYHQKLSSLLDTFNNLRRFKNIYDNYDGNEDELKNISYLITRLKDNPRYHLTELVGNLDFKNYFEYLKEKKEETSTIQRNIIETVKKIKSLKTAAEQYKFDIENPTLGIDTIAATLRKKIYEEEDYNRINIEGKVYQTIYQLGDRSVAITKKDNSIITADSPDDIMMKMYDLVKDHINQYFNKNPTLGKFFIDRLDNQSGGFYELASIMKKFKENKASLKAAGFDIFEFTKSYESDKVNLLNIGFLEDLNDEISKVLLDYNVKCFAESIASNKYRHLYDEETYKLFRAMYDDKVSREQLQKIVGTKIAAFDNPETFNEFLKATYQRITSFTLENIIEKSLLLDATIISHNDNKLIIQVEDFNQSKQLGSSSWCISRDEMYFNSYTKDNNFQYFIFDFNLIAKDEMSLIGITLDKDNEVYAAHSRFDDALEKNNPILKAYQNIIIDSRKDKKLEQSIAFKL